MHREESLALEEGSELEVDSDKDRDRGSPRQGRRASPQRLPPVRPPPRGPLPSIPPSPPHTPVPPPKSSSIRRPFPSVSDNRLRAPSFTSSRPRPFSAPVQGSHPRHHRASPPALPLSAPTVQKPPRTTHPDLQQTSCNAVLLPLLEQQSPMGIPESQFERCVYLSAIFQLGFEFAEVRCRASSTASVQRDGMVRMAGRYCSSSPRTSGT